MSEVEASWPPETYQETAQVVLLKNSFHLNELRLNAALDESVVSESLQTAIDRT